MWSSTSTGNIVWDTENVWVLPHDGKVYLNYSRPSRVQRLYMAPVDQSSILGVGRQHAISHDDIRQLLDQIDDLPAVREVLEKMSDELNNTSSPIQDAQFCKEQFYEMLGITGTSRERDINSADR